MARCVIWTDLRPMWAREWLTQSYIYDLVTEEGCGLGQFLFKICFKFSSFPNWFSVFWKLEI
jgi:hypothetical protein